MCTLGACPCRESCSCVSKTAFLEVLYQRENYTLGGYDDEDFSKIISSGDENSELFVKNKGIGKLIRV